MIDQVYFSRAFPALTHKNIFISSVARETKCIESKHIYESLNRTFKISTVIQFGLRLDDVEIPLGTKTRNVDDSQNDEPTRKINDAFEEDQRYYVKLKILTLQRRTNRRKFVENLE